jgi:hypothetical protein
MCHSIERVKSTMGQGDFLLEYPKLHQLAASKNPVVRWGHDYVTELNPEAPSPRLPQANSLMRDLPLVASSDSCLDFRFPMGYWPPSVEETGEHSAD